MKIELSLSVLNNALRITTLHRAPLSCAFLKHSHSYRGQYHVPVE